VVTLMTDDQVADVRDLTRKAGIAPTTTRLSPGHPLLATLAPGQRVFVFPTAAQVAAAKAATEQAGVQKQRQGRGARGGPTSGKRSGSSSRSRSGERPTGGDKGSSSTRGAKGSRGAGAGQVGSSARSGGAAAFSSRGGARRRSA